MFHVIFMLCSCLFDVVLFWFRFRAISVVFIVVKLPWHIRLYSIALKLSHLPLNLFCWCKFEETWCIYYQKKDFLFCFSKVSWHIQFNPPLTEMQTKFKTPQHLLMKLKYGQLIPKKYKIIQRCQLVRICTFQKSFSFN